jgi:hypothetical protein
MIDIECFINLITDIIIENKLIIMGFFIYKIIGYLSNKINISSYSYDGGDDLGNDVKVKWFNANYLTQNLFYRFEVDIDYFQNKKPKIKGYVIIINRNDILFFDKLKLIYFFLSEYTKDLICLKIKANRSEKKLPLWFLRTYIFPNTIFI